MRIDPQQPDGPSLREALRTALDVGRWVDEVAVLAPYASADALLRAAEDALARLTEAEIDEALAAHPRIGVALSGTNASAAISRAEQDAPDAGDPALAARIAEGNRRYEERFGRVFLVRAKGRTRAQIAAILDERLRNDDATELASVRQALSEITMLRLRDMLDAPAEDRGPLGGQQYAGKSAITTHVLDIHRGQTALGMRITLERNLHGSWHHLDEGLTNKDGRIDVLGPERVEAGHYRLTFDTAEYFERFDQEYFFPVVVVSFDVSDLNRHYHVPIMLSPFGYSTYRGS